MRHIAKIPFEQIENNIKWLLIEPHVHDGIVVGYYLFHHQELNEPCESDTWFEKLEFAKQSAFEDYGIIESDWILKEN